MKDAIVIQQNWGHDSFQDMMRLTYQRHAAYTRAHGMDYWHISGEIHSEMYPGGWSKIWLMKDAIERGYKFIAWIDADAAIVDFEADLRDAPIKDIGACLHTPEKSDWLKQNQVPPHMNVGVLYIKVTDESTKFISDWLNSYPGDLRWMEQGSFNKLAESNDIVGVVDDKWNATVNVSMVDKPVVKGYHGVSPLIDRFNLMRFDFIEDHIKFRV